MYLLCRINSSLNLIVLLGQRNFIMDPWVRKGRGLRGRFAAESSSFAKFASAMIFFVFIFLFFFLPVWSSAAANICCCGGKPTAAALGDLDLATRD